MIAKNHISVKILLVGLLLLFCKGAEAAKSRIKNDGMTLEQARQYMVTLINLDRRRYGLTAVTLDPIATKAGQLHTDKLLAIGAHGHFEPDGTKPPQRYNFCGGTDYVAENAFSMGYCDRIHKVSKTPSFSRATLYALESGWMKSPMHKKNILDKDHTHVGIGLSQSEDGTTVSAVQEFINKYGNIEKIPIKAYRGQRVHVTGTLNPGYKVKSVSVFREDLPRPMSINEINSKGSYGPATERVTAIFPRQMALSSYGFGASIEVKEDWKTGLYYCVTWAENTRTNEAIPVSMLTFYVL